MGRYFLVKTVDFSRNAIVLPPDYSKQYLTFEAVEDGTFSFSNNIYYSIDNGETWVKLTANTQSPTINTGDKIMWKGNLRSISGGIGTFSSTGQFNGYGNVMSLLYGDNFEGKYTITYSFCFYRLFRQNNIVYAHNLILPATTLANYCYCSMFSGCRSLVTAPELPATTLIDYCYYSMFNGCRSLVTAPELPATALAGYCYDDMFENCTSLTTAPELPATTLVGGCYDGMFRGCSNLNYIKMLATDISASLCLSDWVFGVSSTGTFVKNANATWDVTGYNGVPTNWTIITQ